MGREAGSWRDRKGDRNEEAFLAHRPHLFGQKLLTDLTELLPEPPSLNRAAGPSCPAPRLQDHSMGFPPLFFVN